MTRTTNFFHELTFEQLGQLAERRYSLKVHSSTNSRSLKIVQSQLHQFKELLRSFYFHPGKFDSTPFFSVSPFLVYNFLRLSHVYYLEKKIPEIEQFIALLMNSESSPETRLLPILFYDYRIGLEAHIAFEESQVFPLIHSLIEARLEDALFCKSAQLRAQLASFYVEHTDTEKDLGLMKKIVSSLQRQERGVASVLYNQLSLFEADLKLHHVLEEEILIPAVLDIL